MTDNRKLKRRNMLYRLITGCLLILCMITMCPENVSAAETKRVSLASEQISVTSTRLTWKKKTNVKKYKLVYYYYTNDGTKKKTTVTLKGDAHSYTVKSLKKSKDYWFKLYGYDKKGNKIYYDITGNYTGFLEPEFLNDKEEYGVCCEGFPDYISLHFADGIGADYNHGGEGIPAKAIQIFRKESGGSYERIKTVKGNVTSYTDKDVVTGKTYTYKLRSYYLKKVDGQYKKVYSDYSYKLTLTAANKYGTFTLYTLTQLGKPASELVVKLSADPLNQTYELHDRFFTCTDTDGQEQQCDIIQVSEDGNVWTDMPNVFKLKAGKSVYLKFKFDHAVTLSEGTSFSNDDYTLNFKLTNDEKGSTAKEQEYTY